MFSLTSGHVYHLYRNPCDMRKSFDALSGIVISQLGRNVTGGEVFVFLSKNRSCIKLLHWEKDGFVLYYKRLEKGTFSFPKIRPESTVIHWSELVLIIEGIEVEKIRQKPRFSVQNSS